MDDDRWFRVAVSALALFFIGMGASPAASAEFKVSDLIEKLTVGGDIRIRQEGFWKSTPGQVDRHRSRYRLRLNAEYQLPDDIKVKVGLASGTGEQVSTNQSFDNLSSQNGIFIDKASVEWQLTRDLKLGAGRMGNPFWTVYSSDVVWDGDFSPMGFSQSLIRNLGESDSIFINALEMVADEDGGDQRDQWMFGGQMGFSVDRPSDDWGLKAAGALYVWTNEQASTFGQGATNEGNRRTGPAPGILATDFSVAEITAEYKLRINDAPILIQGTYIQNLSASLTPQENTGYQIGIQYGNARFPGDWEVAYFNKRVETDATVADISDSDFGDGGTNRKGHIMWFSKALTDVTKVNAKYFMTEVGNTALAPGADNINRLQLDVSIKI